MNMPEPIFENLRGSFKVTFKKQITNDNEKFTEKFTENQKLIIKILKENPNITQEQLSIKIKVSKRAIKNNFKILKDKNIIERIGSDKKGYWIIKNITIK